jgi:signal peptidase II
LTAASKARESARAATSRGPRWALFVGLAVAVVVLDQLSKAWIVGNLDAGHPIVILGDWLRLVLVHNTGGLFGLFGGQAPIFAVFSIVVIGLIVWYERQVGRGLFATLALGLLVGGAIGNLIDRIRFGYVNDFVDMGIGTWRFYTYNLADSAISASLLLLIVLALWGDASTGSVAVRFRRRSGEADSDEAHESADEDARE